MLDNHNPPEKAHLEISTMKKDELAARLLRGSHNIDRMRREIEELTKMVIGFVKKIDRIKDISPYAPTGGKFGSPADGFEWTVESYGDETKGVQININCYLYSSGGVKDVGYSSKDSFRIRAENVQAVYESLQFFLTSMLLSFPELKGQWGYLTRAAEVEFTT